MKTSLTDDAFKRIAKKLATPPESIYHTTSKAGLESIIETGEIRPKNYESFVSFSASPAELYDISGNDYIIEVKIPEGVTPVDYTEEWYEAHPEQASYIAGEGWQEQFTYSPETLDEEGWEDEDLMEEEWRSAELESFLWKENEQEWISEIAGESVPVEIINCLY